MSDLTLTLRDVVVTRRDATILGPISFELDATAATVVIGPNGSGKTTLLKTMHGVERYSGGDLTWSMPEDTAHELQSYVFQTPVMLRRSVRQNLAYPLQLKGLAKAEIEARVQAWADRIGLAAALDRPAPRLSGGERQKLAVARALIREPRLLFLDEPCANLDGRATREIEALLQEARAGGTGIVMTTHDMGQARRIASDVVFLLNGQIHDHAPAPAFFAGPKTPEARAFLKGDIVE